MEETKIRWPYDDWSADKAAIDMVMSLVERRYKPAKNSSKFLIHQNLFINAAEILDAARKIFDCASRRYADSLKAIKYKDYLESAHWHAVRHGVIEAAKNRCQVCNSGGALHVHHRTYARRGEERPEDLTVLCAGCHSEFHKNGKLKPEPKD